MLREAHLPWQKGLKGSDHLQIDPKLWRERQAENVLLFGPSGVGTNLAIAITMAMIEQDQACRFLPATALVQLLQKAKASYELAAMIQKLDRYSLLVIDDINYVRRSELETSVLFELICHHYKRRSLLVTSNQPFREWDEIFPSGSMTVAAVDRLVHHCQSWASRGRATGKKQQLQGFQAMKLSRLRN
ncbi:MAG: ATP-binding protein [Cyanobium sp. LacPavin_0920_WC12_MAG_62_9]|nr:ATP-binding protein [Cyanobium sp. LacPavin_0920_WC12_MAG_62_9]